MVQEVVSPTAPQRAASSVALDAFRKILVPVDMSDDAPNALHTALALQRAFGSEVHVVTFTEFGENEEFNRGLGALQTEADLESSTTGRLRRFVENVAPGSLERVTCRAIEDNDIPGGIDRAVLDLGATLVVLTTHRPASLFRTRVERIIQALDLPVLLLKRPPPPQS